MDSRIAWGLLLAVLPSSTVFAQYTIEYYDKPVRPPSSNPTFDWMVPQRLSTPTNQDTFFIGSTLINLRGMNSTRGTRTLVLVDGRREGGVDLSFLPSILLSRMESVTAGARSASRSTAPSEPASLSALGTPLVQEAIVAAPVANVWRAWSTSSGLSAWLAPVATIELMVGGTLRASYDGSGVQSDTAVVSEVLAFDPQRMLSFRVTRAARSSPFLAAVHSTWTVVDLEPAGDAATRVRIVVNGLDASAAEARAFFERDNAETLRRLVQRFGTN